MRVSSSRSCLEMLDDIGMEAFAGRARRELRAAGRHRPQACLAAASS